MAQKKTYSIQQMVAEVKKRLGIIHCVDDRYDVGRNKIMFNLNKSTVTIHRDKEENIKKTIVECEEMFPCAFIDENSNASKYSEKEVIKIVNSLDTYFMETAGYDNPVRTAICSKYNSLKFALLPFFCDFSSKESIEDAQNQVLDILSYEVFNEESNTVTAGIDEVLICYIGKNTITDVRDKVFYVLAGLEKLDIFIIPYENGKLIEDNDESIKTYQFRYDEYTGQQICSVVKKVIKTHYAFINCKINFVSSVVTEEDQEVDE